MWYFTWVLGLGLAAAFAVMNAMWLELDEPEDSTNPKVGSKLEVGP